MVEMDDVEMIRKQNGMCEVGVSFGCGKQIGRKGQTEIINHDEIGSNQ